MSQVVSGHEQAIVTTFLLDVLRFFLTRVNDRMTDGIAPRAGRDRLFGEAGVSPPQLPGK